MDLAMVPKKLLHPSPSSCRHHNSPAPTGMAKHFCKAVLSVFQESQERGLETRVLFAHVKSQVHQRGEQENIANPILLHPLKHTQPIKIISIKINFDHMNACVGKT